MGRKLRATLHKLHSDVIKKRSNVLNIKGIRTFEKGDLVFVQNFCDEGKWIRGTITSAKINSLTTLCFECILYSNVI